MAIATLAGCSKESRIDKTLKKADSFLEAGDYQEAEIEFFKALRLDSRQPEAVRNLAVLYSEQGRWSLAAPFLLQGLEVVPEDLEVRMWLGTLYLVSGRTEDASAQAEYILEQQPTNTDALLILAEAARRPDEMKALLDRFDRLGAQEEGQPGLHLAVANLLLRRGDLESASAEVHRALELDPQSFIGQVILGQVLAAQGLRKEAEEAYQKGFSLAPQHSLRRIQWPVYLLENGRGEDSYQLLKEVSDQNPGAVWALVPLARAALELGKLEESERWIDAALELDRRNIETLTLQAQLTLRRGDVDEAMAVLERLARDHPESARMNYQLALGYIASGNESGAISTLQRVMELNPGFVPPALMLAELHLRGRDIVSAQSILRPLSQRLPTDRRVQLLQAEAFTLAGSADLAETIYRELLAYNASDTVAAFKLGEISARRGDGDDARNLFRQVLDHEPDYLPAVTYLANLDIEGGDLPAAVERLTRYVERNPESAAARLHLGQSLRANGEEAAAEKQFKRVVALVPNQSHGYIALARLYLSQTNREADAREQLEALLAGSPRNPQALLMLAMLDSSAGNYPSARDRYEEVLAQDEANLPALNNLALLYATQFGEMDRAVEMAMRARKNAPKDPSIADTYGWVLLLHGDDQQGLRLLQEAAAMLPHTGEVLYHLGMAFYLNGLESDAQTAFEEAVRGQADEKYFDEVAHYLALLRIRPGETDPATVALLEKALQERPSDPVVLKRLSASYEGGENPRKALELYQAAYDAKTNSVPVLVGLAQACSAFPEKSAQALELARQARRLAPEDAEVAHALGRLAFRSGDFQWALSLLQESAAQLPDDGEVLADLAVAYYSVGRLPEASETLQQAISVLEESTAEPWVRFQQMVALQQELGEVTVARGLAETALAEDPDSIPARMVLGMTAELQGDPALAQQCYRTVLEVYPESLPTRKRMAILAAEHLQDDTIAYEYGSTLREAMPGDAELACSLGKVMYRRGEFRYAEQLLREGLAAAPDSPDELYYLGLSQLRLGLKSTAEETLVKALRLEPDHDLAAEARNAMEQP